MILPIITFVVVFYLVLALRSTIFNTKRKRRRR
jgi:hypothetical protein